MAAGVGAAFFPDADSLLSPFFGMEFTLKHHRGLTNSVFLAVPFVWLLAWLFERLSRKKRWGVFFLICLVEILAHTFLDLLTSYGTMLLSSFSSNLFALDWIFIIDLPLTAAFFFGLLGISIWPQKAQRLARVSLMPDRYVHWPLRIQSFLGFVSRQNLCPERGAYSQGVRISSSAPCPPSLGELHRHRRHDL